MYHSPNSHCGCELTEKKLMHYLSTLKSGVCHEHDDTLIWKSAVSANVVKRRWNDASDRVGFRAGGSLT